jgi:hypothetical protein
MTPANASSRAAALKGLFDAPPRAPIGIAPRVVPKCRIAPAVCHHYVFAGMSSEPATSIAANVATADTGSDAGDERISLGDPQQVQEWALRLGVSVEHLRELVAQVGPRVSDLQQRLSQPPVVD